MKTNTEKPTALLYQYCLYISIRISFHIERGSGALFYSKGNTDPHTERRLYDEQSEIFAMVDTKISTNRQTNTSITEV
jgi:hypothetical protein